MMVVRPHILPALAAVAALTLQVAPAAAEEPVLQCVPYARQVSGIQIQGDAHSWWQQADGRYQRGTRPVRGAVMAFKPHRSMHLGHVAAVSKVVDSRRVLLDHANWSPINGRKGQIERDVLAEDVSAANDWSEVRVWYAPIGGLGTTHYPGHGFIYPEGRAPARLEAAPTQLASGTRESTRAERKAQREADKAAEKEARRKLKEIEQQRREYAKYLKQQKSALRDTARLSSPNLRQPQTQPPQPRPLSQPQTDPIGDLIGQLGV